MNADQLDSPTERVLGAVFEVTNTLGAGFLENVYQRARLRELGLRGIRAVAEASFTVTYKGHSAKATLPESTLRISSSQTAGSSILSCAGSRVISAASVVCKRSFVYRGGETRTS